MTAVQIIMIYNDYNDLIVRETAKIFKGRFLLTIHTRICHATLTNRFDFCCLSGIVYAMILCFPHHHQFACSGHACMFVSIGRDVMNVASRQTHRAGFGSVKNEAGCGAAMLILSAPSNGSAVTY